MGLRPVSHSLAGCSVINLYFAANSCCQSPAFCAVGTLALCSVTFACEAAARRRWPVWVWLCVGGECAPKAQTPRKPGPSPLSQPVTPHPHPMHWLEPAWGWRRQAGVLKPLGWKVLLAVKINTLVLLGLHPPAPRPWRKREEGTSRNCDASCTPVLWQKFLFPGLAQVHMVPLY